MELYCTVLYCSYCIVSYCIVLYCTILHCSILDWNVFYRIILCCGVLFIVFSRLCCVVLCGIMMYLILWLTDFACCY